MSLFQIHCYTTRIARRLAGGTDAVRLDLGAATKNPDIARSLLTFRAPPAYRSQSAIELRKAVADIVKQERKARVG